jgi:hypothetical protein
VSYFTAPVDQDARDEMAEYGSVTVGRGGKTQAELQCEKPVTSRLDELFFHTD